MNDKGRAGRKSRRPARRRLLVWLASILALALLVAACGEDATDDDDAAAPVDDAADDTEEPDEPDEPDEVDEPEDDDENGDDAADDGDDLSDLEPFSVAMTTPGVGVVPLMEAVERMREKGAQIENPIVDDVGLIMDGLFRNEFQFSSGSTSGSVVAISEGAPIRLIADRTANEWVLAATTDIQECEDLDGVGVGVHFEASADQFLTRAWVAENCPDIEPDYQVVRGSPNRTTALLGGQLEAATQETWTVTELLQAAPDDFHVLASYLDELPPMHPSSIYGNSDFMEENREVVVALLTELIEVHREIEGDAEFLKELAREHLDDVDEETLDEAAPFYIDNNIFHTNLGDMTMETIQETLDVMLPDVDVTAEEVADLSYLEEALDQVGEQ